MWIVGTIFSTVIVPGTVYSWRTYHPQAFEGFLKSAVSEFAMVGYWKLRFEPEGDKHKSCVGMDRVLYGCFLIQTRNVKEFKQLGIAGSFALWMVGVHLIYTAPETEVEQQGSFAKLPMDRKGQFWDWTDFMRHENGLIEKIPNPFYLVWQAGKMAVNGEKMSEPTPNFKLMPSRLPASVTQ